MPVSPELDLVTAACRWPPSAGRDLAVRRAADRGIDGDQLLRVARRHRVEGLVHDALTRSAVTAPAPAAEALAATARHIARQNLGFAAEAVRIGAALTEAAVPFLFVKGVTLSILAYGSLALKKASDIDVAADPNSYAEAIRQFRALGYQCFIPGPEADDDELIAWTASSKHTIWLGNGNTIELHMSLVDSPLMLVGVSVLSPRQCVSIAPGMSLPTLAKDELYAYLCVHGATHAWSRLKWLADLAAFLKDEAPDSILGLHRRSLELGGGRSSAQALLLCADLFEMALPAALEAGLRADRANRALVRAAKQAIGLGGGSLELDDTIFGTIAIHTSHLRLLPGWRFKAAELRRKFAGTAGTPVGSRLIGALLAAPLWLLRRARVSRPKLEAPE